MKAVILAAGKGSRLRPHTDKLPKCMVEIAGKPIIHHQLKTLAKAGVKDVTVVGGYQSDKITGDFHRVQNHNFETTNMVSSLFCAENCINDSEDLLISYGDIIYEPRVISNLISSQAPITLSIDRDWMHLWSVRMENPLVDVETLKLRDGKYVIEIGKKPQSLDEVQGQYMGLIKVRAKYINDMYNSWLNLDRYEVFDGQSFDNIYMTSFLQHLIDSCWTVEASFTNGGWVEVDTASDLKIYNEMWHQNRLDDLIKIHDMI